MAETMEVDSGENDKTVDVSTLAPTYLHADNAVRYLHMAFAGEQG
jgi:hypothetical protein